MLGICGGIRVLAKKRKHKERESVFRIGAGRPSGCKDIRGEDWRCANREYVYGN